MVKFVLALGFIFLIAITGVLLYNSPQETVQEETNYLGLVQMGLAPSANSREIMSNDEDTGLRFLYNDKTYALIKSKTWSTGDYGKTFLMVVS